MDTTIPEYTLTVVPYGVSGIKPVPEPPVERIPAFEQLPKSEDASDQEGTFTTNDFFKPPVSKSIEELLEEIEDQLESGDISLETAIQMLQDIGESQE